MMRVIGRLPDLAAWTPAAGHERLADAHPRWSLARNVHWIDDGLQRGETFLQVSPAAPGSVLAFEVERIRRAGYVRAGPFLCPRDWYTDPARYAGVVRACAAFTRQRSSRGAEPPVFVPKAEAELEPLLALWPHVLVRPTAAVPSLAQCVLARAARVHTLGMTARATWADGALRSPGEFFFHDVDHARFKIREDLLLQGVDVGDAYVNGSTFDRAANTHRTILPRARAAVGPVPQREARERRALARRLLACIAATTEASLRAASLWLLFELVHEKSLPLDRRVLDDALSGDAHVDKLHDKVRRRFHGRATPAPAVARRFAAARAWLRAVLAETDA